jgi:hypothetical protein
MTEERRGTLYLYTRNYSKNIACFPPLNNPTDMSKKTHSHGNTPCKSSGGLYVLRRNYLYGIEKCIQTSPKPRHLPSLLASIFLQESYGS